MANKDLEMKIYVDGPIHTAFMELAEAGMEQGVQIDSIQFNWGSDMYKIGELPKIRLLSIRIQSSKTAPINIQSSKAGDKTNGR